MSSPDRRGDRGRDTAWACVPSPFSASAAPPIRGWDHQSRSQGPTGGEGYSTERGGQVTPWVRLPFTKVCRKRKAGAHTLLVGLELPPSLPGVLQGAPHYAPWPAWGECPPQGGEPQELAAHPAFLPSPSTHFKPGSPWNSSLPSAKAFLRKWDPSSPLLHCHAPFLVRKGPLHLIRSCLLRDPSTTYSLLHFQLLSPVPHVNVLCHLE